MYNDNSTNVIDSVDIVEYISQYTSLSFDGNEYIGLCPFHQEVTPSFHVSAEKKRWFCFGCKLGGTVIQFAAKMNNTSVRNAQQQLCYYYGITPKYNTQSQTESVFRRVKQSKNTQTKCRHEILNKSLYNNFSKVKIQAWCDEGIPESIIDDYNVRMDVINGRIVYPVYDNNGNFINVKGRTIYPDYKELGEPKYINYFKVGKVDYFQAYYRNRKFIAQSNEVIIFEGIKSVMKLEAYGHRNAMSAETSRINEYQLRFLISLRCNVVIAFDNDVDYNKINDTLSLLAHFTNVSVIEDKENLLGGNKMSPVDRGRDIWEMLYNRKRRVFV